MHLPARPRLLRHQRTGKTLALFIILLPALCGMVGLVIDTGLMMAAHRDVQTAADSAALAAALRLMDGDSADTAKGEATTFVETYNDLSSATVVVNIGPSQGPHAGNANYAEVIVTYEVTTLFMGALGVDQSTVSARAVAGFEAAPGGEGAIVLDQRAIPGLSVSGGATLKVNGTVVVNSWGKGLDQYGQTVDWGQKTYAATTSNNSAFQAQYIQVHGGVDTVANFQNITAGGPNPLFCRAGIAPDPLANLAVPTQSNVPSITNWTRQAPLKVGNNQTQTLQPGVYEDIQISNGATVTFQPGVYILSPQKPNEGLSITGDCTVTGHGVMFYATGSDYLDQSAGHWDAVDGAVNLDTSTNQLPAAPDPQFNKVNFASVTINATNANVSITGITDPSSPYYNMSFFQRRRNQSDFNIQGNAGQNVILGGTLYAKWATFKIAGGGKYNASFIAGSMAVSGQADVTINSTGKQFGAANQVFLVE
jgi:Flp pilus assembly protein TadG